MYTLAQIDWLNRRGHQRRLVLEKRRELDRKRKENQEGDKTTKDTVVDFFRRAQEMLDKYSQQIPGRLSRFLSFLISLRFSVSSVAGAR